MCIHKQGEALQNIIPLANILKHIATITMLFTSKIIEQTS